MKRLKDLETENARLRKVVLRSAPDELILQPRLHHICARRALLVRAPCLQALGQHRSAQRKVPQGRDDEGRLTDTWAAGRIYLDLYLWLQNTKLASALFDGLLKLQNR